MTEQEKQEIINEVAKRVALSQKSVLTSQEASAYLGISLSSLYKMTCLRQIPHFKPRGKQVYFEREEIEAWALQNRIAANAEISDRARVIARRQR